MRRLHDYYLATISGEQRRGIFGVLILVVLVGLSWGYRLALCLRTALLMLRKPRALSVPVVSVGNITTGGTGKTPTVIYLSELLESKGRKVGVVSRGYKGGDEALMLAEKLPAAHIFASRDRLAAGRQAVAAAGCDIVVLDDAFHKRHQLRRELDLVMVNGLNPFGYGRLLPAGLLREPLSGLADADIVLMGNSDLCTEEQLARIEERVRGYSARVEVFRCRYVVQRFRDRDSGAAQEKRALAGKQVIALCGIGSPDSFLGMLRREGVELAGQAVFPDHHIYRPEDLEETKKLAAPGTTIVTTEKDAVKLSPGQLPGLLVAEVELVIDEAQEFEASVLRRFAKV